MLEELTPTDLLVRDYLVALHRVRCLELVEEMQYRGIRVNYDDTRASLERLEQAGMATRNSRGYWRPVTYPTEAKVVAS